MRSVDLTEEQLLKIKETVERFERFLTTMQGRMVENSFPADDALAVATAEAREAVRKYALAVHDILRTRRRDDLASDKQRERIRKRRAPSLDGPNPFDDWPRFRPFKPRP